MEKLIEKELERANAKHGIHFPTIEHSLSVIREEVEEVHEESQNLQDIFNKIWKGYRNGKIDDKDFARLEMHAKNVIEESVQVIAMIKKHRYSNIDSRIKIDKRIEE